MLNKENNRDEIMARKLATLIQQAGGTAYYVGGYVRDKLMGRDNKDIDIEVHGLTAEQLLKILKEVGEPDTVGSSFGIYTLHHYDLDISLPRKDNSCERGKENISEQVDPFVGTEKAARRRDLTINALMEDIVTGEIVDHFSGKEDIEKGIIRHVDEVSFSEDPLRVLRVAQFAARFDFTIADETIELSKRLSLEEIPRERIFGELEKALLKADRPSIFFESLKKMNHLSLFFPEVEGLIGLEQDPVYHPEGDVWNHTMQVIDAAAKMRNRAGYPMGFMVSALCHDFGKIVTTEKINGRIHAYKHETEGIDLVLKFLDRLTNIIKIKSYVANMVKLHMRPYQMAKQKSAVKSMCRMYDEAESPEDLLLLVKADNYGQVVSGDYDETESFLNDNLMIFKERVSSPQVAGRDLVDAGFKPDKDFKDALDYAHKLQLSGVEKENALKHTVSYLKKGRNG